MSALFGALGSLAESYGLAQQRVQQNALEQIRQRLEEARQHTEERYADIASQRLAQEKEQTGFERQKFEEQIREFNVQREREENTWQKLDLPPWRTADGRVWARYINPYNGKTKDFAVPGMGKPSIEDLKDTINTVKDPAMRDDLSTTARSALAEYPNDPEKALANAHAKVEARREKLLDAAAKANKTTGMKPEAKTALAILQTSLFGGEGQPGLNNTLGVLDDPSGRLLMRHAGVGQVPGATAEGGLVGLYDKLIGGDIQSSLRARMDVAQKRYAMQLDRAFSAINGLRPLLGNPRSSLQLSQQFMSELPNPKNVSSRNEALEKLALVKREIDAALRANGIDPATGNPITPSGEVPAVPIGTTGGATGAAPSREEIRNALQVLVPPT